MACLALSVGFPDANAAYVSVTPTGSFDAQAATAVSYDIFFNVETNESFSFIGWDLDLRYDPGELANWTASNLLAGDIAQTAPDTLNFLYLDILGTTDFTTTGAHRLATVSFDIIGPAQPFDGMADFEVLSQLGTGNGFATMVEILQFDGALGADVGAVPIPGAFWLLGSGMAALFGFKRRTKN